MYMIFDPTPVYVDEDLELDEDDSSDGDEE